MDTTLQGQPVTVAGTMVQYGQSGLWVLDGVTVTVRGGPLDGVAFMPTAREMEDLEHELYDFACSMLGPVLGM
jgi:hypothetical protein